MDQHEKIRPIEELATVVADLRSRNRSIVHCHGLFDHAHIVVISHLARAKQMGDVLVVTVTPDEHAGYPRAGAVFVAELRAEAIAALSQVDYVAIARGPTAAEAIRLLRPDVYVPWDDAAQTGAEAAAARRAEEAAVDAVGGRVVHLKREATLPAGLYPYDAPSLPKESCEFIESFSSRHARQDIRKYLDSARSLRVLLVGEAIVDEYQYCETMGKSGKEPVLVVRYLSTERFAGGVLATANQAAAFCDHVGMLTLLGAQDSHEEFIRERLDAKIEATFLAMPDAPTIVKRRMVEIYPFQKLFEVYVMDDEVGEEVSHAVCARLEAVIADYDAVIVTDYGHGMLSAGVIDLLCRKSRFLAVNTQTNAANQGFNTISKYSRADYVCLSEREIRLEARSHRKDLRRIIPEIGEMLSCPRMLVTQGPQGCLCYEKGKELYRVPPFTNRIVDRVGAGDALFAVTSLCAARQAPVEIIGFLGNAVGAQAVEVVGNREVVSRAALWRQIESLVR